MHMYVCIWVWWKGLLLWVSLNMQGVKLEGFQNSFQMCDCPLVQPWGRDKVSQEKGLSGCLSVAPLQSKFLCGTFPNWLFGNSHVSVVLEIIIAVLLYSVQAIEMVVP